MPLSSPQGLLHCRRSSFWSTCRRYGVFDEVDEDVAVEGRSGHATGQDGLVDVDALPAAQMFAAERTGEFSVDEVFGGASNRRTGGSGRDSFLGDRLGCADVRRQAAYGSTPCSASCASAHHEPGRNGSRGARVSDHRVRLPALDSHGHYVSGPVLIVGAPLNATLIS